MKKISNSELERKTLEEYKMSKKTPIVILLDNVRSLNNVGSTFRSADAFLVEKIFLCGITGKPPHRDIQKTALGATESVDWEYGTDSHLIIHDLKLKGYVIVSIEQVEGAVSLEKFEVQSDKKYCLVFGNEVFGVSDSVLNLSDSAIDIKQYGTKHSLNISVCVGIVLWEFFKKLS